MLKNAHLHLAYAYLMLQNPQSCLKHIEILRTEFTLSPDTEFIVSQYFNEVQTLMRNQEESVDKQMSLNGIDETKEYQVYSGATSFYLQETIPAKVMASMNQTASLAAFNNLSEAKRRINQMLTAQLGQTMQVSELNAQHILPSFVIHMLVYIFVKNGEIEKAKQLVKRRRILAENPEQNEEKLKYLIRNFCS